MTFKHFTRTDMHGHAWLFLKKSSTFRMQLIFVVLRQLNSILMRDYDYQYDNAFFKVLVLNKSIFQLPIVIQLVFMSVDSLFIIFEEINGEN